MFDQSRRERLWAIVHRPLSEYRGRQGYPNTGLAWRLDLCKDGSLSIKRSGARSINNGHALPVFSVATKKEAERIQVLLCFTVRGKHPDLPAHNWCKLNDVLQTGVVSDDGVPVFEYDDIKAVAWKLHDVAEVLFEPEPQLAVAHG